MSRRTTATCFLFIFACAVFSACSAPSTTTDAPPLQRPTHTIQAPDRLPGDLVPDSAPEPPAPNHDGQLDRDAGLAIATAVPFQQGVRGGRIAEEDEGDGWLIHGLNGDVVGVEVHNLSDTDALTVRILDHQARPVVMPPMWQLPPGESLHQSFELSRVMSEQTLILVVEAEQALDYQVTMRTE